MRNAVLHLLSNKADGFRSPIFPESSDFVPVVETEAQAKIREFFKLQHPDSDYYLMGAMTAVYAYPDILSDFQETDMTFRLSDWRRDPDWITGGTYAHAQGQFYLHYSPDQWPAPLTWVITYLDDTTLSIRAGDRRYIVKYHTSSSDVLYPEWPEALGIRGGIDLDSTWASSSVVEIGHTPTAYPYDVVVDKLDTMNETFLVLEDEDLTQQYFTAQASIEKVAVVLLALANPSKYYANS